MTRTNKGNCWNESVFYLLWLTSKLGAGPLSEWRVEYPALLGLQVVPIIVSIMVFECYCSLPSLISRALGSWEHWWENKQTRRRKIHPFFWFCHSYLAAFVKSGSVNVAVAPILIKCIDCCQLLLWIQVSLDSSVTELSQPNVVHCDAITMLHAPIRTVYNLYLTLIATN